LEEGIDGNIILNGIFKKCKGFQVWIDLAYVGDKLWTLLISVMNIGLHKMRRICRLSEEQLGIHE